MEVYKIILNFIKLIIQRKEKVLNDILLLNFRNIPLLI